MNANTIEPQNQAQVDYYIEKGGVTLGPWTSHIYRSDPRHLAFLLARYKFCAKMLQGKERVLEIGCGDAFGLPLVKQVVGHVTGVDFEPLVLNGAAKWFENEGVNKAEVDFKLHDITISPVQGDYSAAYSLDVIEHIPADREHRFMKNVCTSLSEQGVFIIGTPNISADKYASQYSREGHINLKSAASLSQLMMPYFHNVFLFSMNDEMVHTGFSPMAHYLFAMGCSKKHCSREK